MSILLRSQFPDFSLETALPSLEMTIQDQYDQIPTVYDKIFNVRTTTRSIWQTSQVSGINQPKQVAEAAQIPLLKMAQGYSATYKPVKYAGMIAVSKEALEDESSEIFTKIPRSFARAFNETIESSAASILNDGFAAGVGPDGQPLFSASHPALLAGVGLQSNLLGTASDLSSSSVKALMTLMRKTRDPAGNRINLRGTTLVVCPDDAFLAYEIANSVNLVNSDNSSVNAVNSIRETTGLKVVVWDYLTSTDAYFLMADPMDTSLNFVWRQKPELESDWEFKSDVSLTKMVGRWTTGSSDWRGVVASAGTGG